MKSEPLVYSLQDLQREGECLWDGVRNYQARNYLQQMAVGDRAFFYHSNTKPPAIVGLMTIVASQQVDPSQFDPHSPYYDPKATPIAPRWYTVRVAYHSTLPQAIPLDRLKATFTPQELPLVQRGSRLSVLPLDPAIVPQILALGGLAPEPNPAAPSDAV